MKRLFLILAVWTGLEPATPCVTGMYSNQLNYQTKIPADANIHPILILPNFIITNKMMIIVQRLKHQHRLFWEQHLLVSQPIHPYQKAVPSGCF